MNDLERLTKLCYEILAEKKLDDNYSTRLKLELKEIEVQGEEKYFLNLFDNNKAYLINTHNLLVPFLLGVCPDFNIAQESAHTIGEYPDIDIDYLPEIQKYLKEEYAPKIFGEEYVCNIGNYSTYGIKSALLDVVRIFNEDRNEILKITKKLPVKDEDGEIITWDAAERICPELGDYFKRHPEIADAAKKLVSADDLDWEQYGYKDPPHRNRQQGQHAAGLIISSVPIADLVPLVRGKDDHPASAWAEGLASQDLSAVGLIKFDFLVVEANNKIALCCKLISERHGIDSICALPGKPNWSDTSYLNDKKCLEMASKGDLKSIFQFDSPGIRQLAVDAGINSFEDLAAISALFRPGTLTEKIDQEFIKRKNGKQKYELHPKMSFLKSTYGLMIYQEDISKILFTIGKIPERDCTSVIKAISKKKVEKFYKYKNKFIENAQIELKCEEKAAVDLWEKIEAFAAYSFNAAHATSYTYVSSRMLWLKCYYPLEFYTAVLQRMDTGDDRIKEYIIDARKHGIDVEKLDINKSKSDFEIINNKIYYGFSKIKGLGTAIAEKIVENQPYHSIEDLVKKIGTDAGYIKPLIGLKLFKESNPLNLYKYCEFRKIHDKKIIDRAKRFSLGILKDQEELKELINFTCPELNPMADLLQIDDLINLSNNANLVKELTKIKNKVKKKIDNHRAKTSISEADDLSFASFLKTDYQLKNELKEESIFDETNNEFAELEYYGFLWRHPLEKCKNFKGFTFQQLIQEDMVIGPVEVLIKKVDKKTSKNNNNLEFWQLEVEDLNETARVNIWKDDYLRWGKLFVVGNLVRLRVKTPDRGYPTYSLENMPRNRNFQVDKNYVDVRVTLLTRER